MQRDQQKKQAKRALRRSTIAAILALEPARRSLQEAQLLQSLATLPGYPEAQTVLFYVKAFAEELDTRPLMLEAKGTGKRVLCPRVDRAEHRLGLCEIQSLAHDLEPGILGIPEPRRGCTEVEPLEVDWALIPGLAFDLQCYRLGRGGGHYDRLLPLMRAQTPCWALAFDCQIVPHLPIEPHDARLGGIATPSRMITRGLQ
ncbi:MAG: 5-formyltetrahydrofolate cyclo-ligase [Isosphaeraceae bacterium]